MLQWIVKSLALFLAVGLVLGGLIWVGKLALGELRDHNRYTLDFADIDCPSPPGQSRAEFLDEVQYLASLPARLRLLEEDLPRRLAVCFASHPWVEKVERVEIAPPKHVRVKLSFRTPSLAVPQAEGTRVVDRHGILLPKGAPADGLPIFPGFAAPPAGPVGTRWGDAAVEAAARASRP
jgi:hypothetical protein